MSLFNSSTGVPTTFQSVTKSVDIYSALDDEYVHIDRSDLLLSSVSARLGSTLSVGMQRRALPLHVCCATPDFRELERQTSLDVRLLCYVAFDT